MNLNIVCGVTLAVSLALIAVAVVIGASLRHAELKSTGTEGRRRVLTPFQVFLLCFFFATVTIFCPIYYIDYLAAETGFFKVIKAFLLSVQNVLRLITLNGDFDNVRDFLSDGTRINGTLASAYSVYAAFMILAAPLLTAGFVLSFFRDASAMLRYSLRPCRELYVMSELNERSLALAKNILEPKRRGRVIVFADVFEKNEKDHELIFSARRLGAICVKKDVTDIGLKYARRCKRKIYLIGEDEDENLEQALKLINRHRKGKFDTKDLEFYAFCVSAESEALLDSIDNGNMKVRRVNGNFNLALGEMRNHPIFYETGKEGTVKEYVKDARIAIVGMGGYGMELVKMICCLGQMPERTVEVHVFDRDDAEQKLRTRAPEFMAFNNADIEGEAKYRIVFHKTDVCGESFPEELSNIKGVTGVYVTLGEDESNIETAIRIRAALKRKNHADRTPVYAVVYDHVKADIVKKNGLTNMEGEKYEIEFIGSLRECYSKENIEQEYLEKIALELHLAWSEKDNVDNDKEKFDRFEYYRRSSFVQAVYRDWREKLINETGRQDREYNRMLRDYEHRRWNTYMRGEGYVRGAKDHIAKTHPMLVPYGDLPESQEIKDDI